MSNDQKKLSLFGDQFINSVSKKPKNNSKTSKRKTKKITSSKKTEKPEKKRGGGFIMATDLLKRFELEDKGGYISQEFQDFGYRMALELDDMPHKSLYIKLAKTESRGVLESVLAFVKDANARNKARLFMWKLKQVRIERKEKPKKNEKL